MVGVLVFGVLVVSVRSKMIASGPKSVSTTSKVMFGGQESQRHCRK